MLNLTAEMLVTMAMSAGAGAVTAFLSNRVVNQEIWGELRKQSVLLDGLARQRSEDASNYHRAHDELAEREAHTETRLAALEIDSAICKHMRRAKARDGEE